MKKFALYICLCFMSAILIFSGCDEPLKGLSVSVTSPSIVVASDGVPEIELEITGSDTALKFAELTATVSGGASHISRRAGFVSLQPEIVNIKSNPVFAGGVTTATIEALKPTNEVESVYIKVFSLENEKVSSLVRVRVKKDITALAPKDPPVVAEVPRGLPTVLDATAFLKITPYDTTETRFVYKIAGDPNSYYSDEPITLSSVGVFSATATSITHPELSAAFQLRVYNPLNSSDVSITSIQGAYAAPMPTSLKLVKNSDTTGANYAQLKITALGDVEITVTDSGNMIGRRLIVDIDSDGKNIWVSGTELTSTILNINISVAGILTDKGVDIKLPVEVVDYPKTIIIDGDADMGVVPDVRVYNNYSAGSRGIGVTINLAPNSAGDKTFLLRSTDSRLSSVIAQFSPPGGGGLVAVDFSATSTQVFESGTTIYFKHDRSSDLGNVNIRVIAAATQGSPLCNEVSRDLRLRLLHGVASIAITSGVGTGDNTNTIALALGSAATISKQITITGNPANADVSDINAIIADTSIVEVEGDFAVSNNNVYINLLAKKVGETSITFRASTGSPLTVYIRVISLLADDGITIVPEDGQSSVAKVETYANGSLKEIHIANNSNKIVRLLNITTPANASVRSLSFDNGLNAIANVESVDARFTHVVSRSTGSVVVTPTVYFSVIDGSGNIVLGSRALAPITIVVYVPVTQITTTANPIEVFGSGNSAKVYTTELAYKQVGVNVLPSNSTITAANAEWQLNNTELVSLDGADGSGIARGATVIVRVKGQLISTVTVVTLTVRVKDYNRVFSQDISVVIRRTVDVQSISVDDYNEKDMVYFETDRGTYVDNISLTGQQKFEVVATLYPSNATNKNIRYLVFDQDAYGNPTTLHNDASPQTIKIVTDANGKKYIVPLAAGRVAVYVIAEDSFTKKVEGVTQFSEIASSMGNAKAILQVFVSDGSEEFPYRISSAADFLEIGKIGGAKLSKHYVLRNSIDFSGIKMTPIGTAAMPFTGSIKGVNYEQVGGMVQYLTGIKLAPNFAGSDSGLSRIGIFGYLGSLTEHATLENIEFSIDSIDIRANNAAGSIYVGGLAGEMYANLTNISVVINSVNIEMTLGAARTVYFGGVAGANGTQVGLGNKGLSSVDVTIRESSIDTGANLTYIGGVVGINHIVDAGSVTHSGQIGEEHGYVIAIVNINVATNNNARLGGIVGFNGYDSIVINSDCEGNLTGMAGNAGGIAGESDGRLEGCFAAARVSAAQNAGGIVGVNRGEVTYCIFVAYDDGKRGEQGVYLKAGSSVGGIAGLMEANALNRAKITYSYAQSYFDSVIDLSDSTKFWGDIYSVNISTNNVGGLAGCVTGSYASTISNSFSALNIAFADGNVSTLNFGGLVGEAQNLVITDSYADSQVRLPLTSLPVYSFGALIGKINSGIYGTTIASVYAAIDGSASSLTPVGYGLPTVYSNIYIRALLTQAQSYYTELSHADMFIQASFGSFDFVNTWLSPLPVAGDVAGRYPQLRESSGSEEPLLRPVEEQIIAAIRDVSRVDSANRLNSVLKADVQKVIIVLNTDPQEASRNVYSLAGVITNGLGVEEEIGIVSYSTIPENIKKVNARIESNNSSAVTVRQSTDLKEVKIEAVGLGTARITVTSKANINAWFEIEICVIEGYSQFNLSGSIDDAEQLGDEHDSQLYIKFGYDRVLRPEFTGSSERTNAGMRVSIPMGYNNPDNGQYTLYNYDSYFIANSLSWEANAIENVYEVFVRSSERVIIAPLDVTTQDLLGGIPVTITPYVWGEFSDGAHKVFIPEQAREFKLHIYQGVTDLWVTPDSAAIEPKGIQTATLVVKTDNVTEEDNVFVEIYEDRACNRLLFKQNGVGSNVTTSMNPEDFILAFSFEPDYSTTAGRLVVVFQFSLRDSAKKLIAPIEFYFKIGVDSDTGGAELDREFSTFDLLIVLQSIDRIDLTHYADADDNTNTMPGAGNLPNDTIIAGDYGLLKIDIAPYFADFEYLEITSNIVGNDLVSFDQRVLVYVDNKTSYASYQEGVTIIPNGIKITGIFSEATTYDPDAMTFTGLSFDGAIYLRTIIKSATTPATQFTITVRAVGRENEKTQARTFSVDSMPELRVTFAGYSMGDASAYIANGTEDNALGISFNKNTGAKLLPLDVQPAGGSLPDAKGVTIKNDGKDNFSIKVPKEGTVDGNAEDNLGKVFKVWVAIARIVNGHEKIISVEVPFTVVNFVVNSIEVEGVENGMFSKGYYKDRSYPMKITAADITVDRTNSVYMQDIDDFINAINGMGMNYWEARNSTLEPGAYLWTQIIARDMDNPEALISHIRNENINSPENYWRYHPKGISNSEYIRARVVYNYDTDPSSATFGKLTLHKINDVVIDTDPNSPTFGKLIPRDSGASKANLREVTTTFNLNFFQNSSLDNPIPIYTLAELIGMQPDRNYILMNHITVEYGAWKPLSVAIASLDGNGYEIRGLQSFAPTAEGQTEQQQLGFFSVVDSRTLLKNITIRVMAYQEEGYTSPFSQILSNYTKVDLGLLAGRNNGTITNCAVISNYVDITSASMPYIEVTWSDRDTDVFNVAGLVGSNYGTITNSRVQGVNIVARGYGSVAGLVAQNYAHISASYYSFGEIKYIAPGQGDNNTVATAGLVARNNTGATILQSYVGSRTNGNEQDYSTTITAETRVGGFVYENYGTISDSYSNLNISSGSRSSGFAFINRTNGIIERSFSISKLARNSVVHTPFIGTENSPSSVVVNNENPYGINDCYYLDAEFPVESRRRDPAKNLSQTEFATPEVFSGFGFSRPTPNGTRGEWHEFSGVWVIPHGHNTYFKYGSFPQLVAPNLIAYSARALNEENSQYDPVSGQMKYVYNADGNRNGTDEGTRFKVDDSLGHEIMSPFGAPVSVMYNPYLVSQAEQMNLYALNDKKQQNVETNHASAYRLVKSVNLQGLSSSSLETISLDFHGDFEGNGLTLSNLDVSINAGVNIRSAGLFSSITTPSTYDANGLLLVTQSTASVRNLKIEVRDILAGNTTYVGALAGIVNNANIMNISVSGTKIAIGRNIVGGVAGYLTGTSRAINISSDFSVSAIYSQASGSSGTNLYTDDLYDFFELSKDNSGTLERVHAVESNAPDRLNSKLNYVGGVFGIVDLAKHSGDAKDDQRDVKSSIVSHISSYGGAQIVGENAGGIFGLIGAQTYATNITKIVEAGGFIKATQFAGGIAAENRGILSLATVSYSNNRSLSYDPSNPEGGASADGIQDLFDMAMFGSEVPAANIDFFQGKPQAIGGLVGYNYGLKSGTRVSGIIVNSFARIDVRNIHASFAGGLVGIMTGGDMKAVFASGTVRAGIDGYVGGLVGAIYDFTDITAGGAGNGLVQDPYRFMLEHNAANDTNRYYYFNSNVQTLVETSTFETISIVNFAVAINNWRSSDFIYYNTLKNQNRLGGLVGHVSAESLFSTAHSEGNNTNFYNSKIYEFPFVSPSVAPVTGTSIDLTAIGTAGMSAKAAADPKTPLELGRPDTLQATKEELFGGWDQYFYNLEGSSRFPILDIRPVEANIIVTNKKGLRQIYWHMDRNYQVTANIDVGAWMPLGDEYYPFTGHLYSDVTGTNAVPTISGLKITNSMSFYTGLFGATKNASIYNLHFKDFNLSATFADNTNKYSGLIVGLATNTRFENLLIDGTNIISTNASFTGGVVGYAARGALDESTELLSTITNVVVNVDISIVSLQLAAGEEDSDPKHTDRAKVSVGVVAGYLNDYVVDGVFSEGRIDTTAMIAATEDSFATGISAGGIIGSMTDTALTNGYASVYIIDEALGDKKLMLPNTAIGGAVGEASNSSITSTISDGDILLYFVRKMDGTRLFAVGGLLGYAESSVYIADCLAAGDITLSIDSLVDTVANMAEGERTQVGGFIGVFGQAGSTNNGWNLERCVSLTSLRNFTRFGTASGKLDAFTFNTNMSKRDETLFYDANLSLLGTSLFYNAARTTDFLNETTTRDLLNTASGETYWEKVGNDLSKTYVVPIVKITMQSKPASYVFDSGKTLITLFSERINTKLGKSEQGVTKFNPIPIGDASAFDAMFSEVVKKYYVQTSTLMVPLRITSSFVGYFNGNGKSILLDNYASISKYSSKGGTTSLGLFNVIGDLDENATLGERGSAAFVTGVKALNTAIDFYSIMLEAKLGAIASEIKPYSIVASTVANGDINVSSHAVGEVQGYDTPQPVPSEIYAGGIAGVSNGQIINSASHVNINISGKSYARIGGLAGAMDNYGYDSVVGAYSFGTLKDNTTDNESYVGGMFGNRFEKTSAIRIINAYTVTDISATSSSKSGNITGAGASSEYISLINVSYDASLSKLPAQGGATGIRASDIRRKAADSNYVAGNTIIIKWFENYFDINEGYPYVQFIDNVNTGNGSSAHPFELSHRGQFEWAVSSVKAGDSTSITYEYSGKYFTLKCDVDASSMALGGTFNGHLLGNGHVVSSLGMSIFNTLSGSVTQLGIQSTSGFSGSGLIAGTLSSGARVDECASFASGTPVMVGANSGTISDCFVENGSVASSGTRIRCYAASSFTSMLTQYDDAVKAIAASYPDLFSEFGKKWVMLADGASAGTDLIVSKPRLGIFTPDLSSIDVSEVFLDGASDGISLKVGSATGSTSADIIKNRNEFARYIGYLNSVSSTMDNTLLKVVVENDVNLAGYHVKPIEASRNVDLKGKVETPEGGQPLPPKKSILNMTVLGTAEGLLGAGLFVDSYGSIAELNLVNSITYGATQVGLLAGIFEGNIEEIQVNKSAAYATGSLDNENVLVADAGLVVGYLGATSTKLSYIEVNNSFVDGSKNVGGIVGKMFRNSELSHFAVNDTLINSIVASNPVSIDSKFTHAGGAVGYVSELAIISGTGPVDVVINAGTKVYGYSNLGGVAGESQGSIIDLRSNAEVNSTIISNISLNPITGSRDGIIGGVVGLNMGGVNNVVFGGRVNADIAAPSLGGGGHIYTLSITNKVGGITGENRGYINEAHVLSSIDGFLNPLTGLVYGFDDVGGIAGYNNALGTISYSSSTAFVYGVSNVGGIAGYVSARPEGVTTSSIERSYNDGAVTGRYKFDVHMGMPMVMSGDTYNIGGLVGNLEGIMTESYVESSAKVVGGYNVGGLAGRCSGTVRYCYSVIVAGQLTYSGELVSSTGSDSHYAARNIGALVGQLTATAKIGEVFADASILALAFDPYSIGITITVDSYTNIDGIQNGNGSISEALDGIGYKEAGSTLETHPYTNANTVITFMPTYTSIPASFAHTLNVQPGAFVNDEYLYYLDGSVYYAVMPSDYVDRATGYYYYVSTGQSYAVWNSTMVGVQRYIMSGAKYIRLADGEDPGLGVTIYYRTSTPTYALADGFIGRSSVYWQDGIIGGHIKLKWQA